MADAIIDSNAPNAPSPKDYDTLWASLQSMEGTERQGDSDDEIAELRIQALLTKRLNEAEVSPSRSAQSRSPRQQVGNAGNNNSSNIQVLTSSVNLSNNNWGQNKGWNNFRGRGSRGRGYQGYNSNSQVAMDSNNQSNFGKHETENLSGSHTGQNAAKAFSQIGTNSKSNLYSGNLVKSDKTAEKNVSARWQRLQSTDSETDSDSDSSDSDSSSSGSSSSSESSSDSNSTSGSSSDSAGNDNINNSESKKNVDQNSKKNQTVSSTLARNSGNFVEVNVEKSTTLPVKQEIDSNLLLEKGSLNTNKATTLDENSPSRRTSYSPFKRRSKSANELPNPNILRTSRSPNKSSRSPFRKSSRSPLRSSRSPYNRISRSPFKKNSRSPFNKDSKSLIRKSSRSPFRKSSRSPYRKFSRSPYRKFSRSPYRRGSRSPYKRSSRSPYRRSSRSPYRRRTRSPFRKGSRSPFRKYSRSPFRKNSRSPFRKGSRSPFRKGSRSPFRKGSRSPFRKGSRSPFRKGSQSPFRKGSRSPFRKGSRSSFRKGSRSPFRKGSRSPFRKGSKSPFRKGSRSPFRKGSRSPFRKGSRSPFRKGSRSPFRRDSRSPFRKGSRSPFRKSSRSPFRRGSRSPFRKGSRSPFRRGSRSPFRRVSRSPLLRKGSRSPFRRSSRSLFRRSSRSPFRRSSRSPFRRFSRSPFRRFSRSPFRKISRSPFRKGSRSPFRKGSKSPFRKGSKSPFRKGSRSPFRKGSRSPFMKGSRSLFRKGSRSPFKRSSRSPFRRDSKSPLRKYQRSPLRKSSKSPFRRSSKSPFMRGSKSPFRRSSKSPFRRSSKSPFRRISKSPFRRSSKSPFRRSSKSPFRRGPKSPVEKGSRSPFRNDSRSFKRGSKSPFRKGSRSPIRKGSVSPFSRVSKYPIESAAIGNNDSKSPLRDSMPSKIYSRSSRPKSVSPYTRYLASSRKKSLSPSRILRSPHRKKSPSTYGDNFRSRECSRSPNRLIGHSDFRRNSKSPFRKHAKSFERDSKCHKSYQISPTTTKIDKLSYAKDSSRNVLQSEFINRPSEINISSSSVTMRPTSPRSCSSPRQRTIRENSMHSQIHTRDHSIERNESDSNKRTDNIHNYKKATSPEMFTSNSSLQKSHPPSLKRGVTSPYDRRCSPSESDYSYSNKSKTLQTRNTSQSISISHARSRPRNSRSLSNENNENVFCKTEIRSNSYGRPIKSDRGEHDAQQHLNLDPRSKPIIRSPDRRHRHDNFSEVHDRQSISPNSVQRRGNSFNDGRMKQNLNVRSSGPSNKFERQRPEISCNDDLSRNRNAHFELSEPIDSISYGNNQKCNPRNFDNIGGHQQFDCSFRDPPDRHCSSREARLEMNNQASLERPGHNVLNRDSTNNYPNINKHPANFGPEPNNFNREGRNVWQGPKANLDRNNLRQGPSGYPPGHVGFQGPHRHSGSEWDNSIPHNIQNPTSNIFGHGMNQPMPSRFDNFDIRQRSTDIRPKPFDVYRIAQNEMPAPLLDLPPNLQQFPFDRRGPVNFRQGPRDVRETLDSRIGPNYGQGPNRKDHSNIEQGHISNKERHVERIDCLPDKRQRQFDRRPGDNDQSRNASITQRSSSDNRADNINHPRSPIHDNRHRPDDQIGYQDNSTDNRPSKYDNRRSSKHDHPNPTDHKRESSATHRNIQDNRRSHGRELEKSSNRQSLEPQKSIRQSRAAASSDVHGELNRSNNKKLSEHSNQSGHGQDPFDTRRSRRSIERSNSERHHDRTNELKKDTRNKVRDVAHSRDTHRDTSNSKDKSINSRKRSLSPKRSRRNNEKRSPTSKRNSDHKSDNNKNSDHNDKNSDHRKNVSDGSNTRKKFNDPPRVHSRDKQSPRKNVLDQKNRRERRRERSPVSNKRDLSRDSRHEKRKRSDRSYKDRSDDERPTNDRNSKQSKEISSRSNERKHDLYRKSPMDHNKLETPQITESIEPSRDAASETKLAKRCTDKRNEKKSPDKISSEKLTKVVTNFKEIVPENSTHSSISTSNNQTSYSDETTKINLVERRGPRTPPLPITPDITSNTGTPSLSPSPKDSFKTSHLLEAATKPPQDTSAILLNTEEANQTNKAEHGTIERSSNACNFESNKIQIDKNPGIEENSDKATDLCGDDPNDEDDPNDGDDRNRTSLNSIMLEYSANDGRFSSDNSPVSDSEDRRPVDKSNSKMDDHHKLPEESRTDRFDDEVKQEKRAREKYDDKIQNRNERQKTYDMPNKRRKDSPDNKIEHEHHEKKREKKRRPNSVDKEMESTKLHHSKEKEDVEKSKVRRIQSPKKKLDETHRRQGKKHKRKREESLSNDDHKKSKKIHLEPKKKKKKKNKMQDNESDMEPITKSVKKKKKEKKKSKKTKKSKLVNAGDDYDFRASESPDHDKRAGTDDLRATLKRKVIPRDTDRRSMERKVCDDNRRPDESSNRNKYHRDDSGLESVSKKRDQSQRSKKSPRKVDQISSRWDEPVTQESPFEASYKSRDAGREASRDDRNNQQGSTRMVENVVRRTVYQDNWSGEGRKRPASSANLHEEPSAKRGTPVSDNSAATDRVPVHFRLGPASSGAPGTSSGSRGGGGSGGSRGGGGGSGGGGQGATRSNKRTPRQFKRR